MPWEVIVAALVLLVLFSSPPRARPPEWSEQDEYEFTHGNVRKDD